jgi:hypothetical protein
MIRRGFHSPPWGVWTGTGVEIGIGTKLETRMRFGHRVAMRVSVGVRVKMNEDNDEDKDLPCSEVFVEYTDAEDPSEEADEDMVR